MDRRLRAAGWFPARLSSGWRFWVLVFARLVVLRALRCVCLACVWTVPHCCWLKKVFSLFGLYNRVFGKCFIDCACLLVCWVARY